MAVVNVVVLYHSGYGHTERVAQAVVKGAQGRLLAVDQDGNLGEQDWSSLNEADAIIMGSPTYMGSVSWQFKKFADASSKMWFAEQWKDKVAGGFTASANLSGDKLSTLQYMATLAMQHKMVWVGQGETNEYKTTGGLNRLGSFFGVMAQCGPQDPASAIPQGDLDTAFAYGKRVTAVAARLK